MAHLGAHRANFTWALNEYNKTDDPEARALNVQRLARYLANAEANGFTNEQIIQGKSYPAEEVRKIFDASQPEVEEDKSENQVQEIIERSVDSQSTRRRGTGSGTVYAYGYRCAPDRLKIGCTDGNAIQRIAEQIGTSTPDKPVLFLEVKTAKRRALERSLHAILTYRGQKIVGGGDEWFITTLDEIEHLCEFLEVAKSDPST